MLWRLIGGLPGVVMICLLAAVGTAIPYRFGFLFVDPAILFGYSAVAFLFAVNFVAEGATGCEDAALVRQVVYGGTLFGWLCWVVILGTSFAALAVMRGQLVLPPVAIGVALVVFSVSLAWFSAALTSLVALTVFKPKAARDLMRMGFFFIVVVMVAGPRFLGGGVEAWLAGLFRMSRFATNLLVISPILVLGGWLALRRAPRILEDRRLSFSITGE
jgi:hypothetical protein